MRQNKERNVFHFELNNQIARAQWWFGVNFCIHTLVAGSALGMSEKGMWKRILNVAFTFRKFHKFSVLQFA